MLYPSTAGIMVLSKSESVFRYPYSLPLIPFKTLVSPNYFCKLMTSITFSKAPFHQFNAQADQQHQNDINQSHYKVRHHELIAVTSNHVEGNVKIGSTDEADYGGFFN